MSDAHTKPKIVLTKYEDFPPFEPIRVMTVHCVHCHKRTCVPSPTVVDAETTMWRKRYEQLLGQLNHAMELSWMIHGTDPMREDFLKQMLKIRESEGLS